MDFAKFQEPDSILRPAPFWAINDRISPEETARQMEDMISVGFSGGFFHSRSGLITEYLGPEWFAAMKAALKVAHEKDGYLWLYDEDLWPSGNAGGLVAAMKDEYRSATLAAELLWPGELPSGEKDSEFRAAYVVEHDGLNLLKAERISYQEACSRLDTERLVLSRVYGQATGWWGGESYANLLHPEAVQQFVKLTHGRYREQLGEEFGKRIPGIFTDEPLLTRARNALPWYDGLPEVYQGWTGREFWADVPYMFFDGPECRKVRLLVHRTILRQFCEAYSKPIFEWCEANNIAHAGHFDSEDHFREQIASNCGGVMAHYRYQQLPGIDHLCRVTEPVLLTIRQVSSAARQLGRRRVLTEIFGVSRHTNSFEDFKWLGDYDLVLGANFLCPHLTLYSARGRRKRDYPPNWNYQQTYWKELNPLNNYFARLGYALTCGEAQVDVLLLHSIESATATHRFGLKSTQVTPDEDLTAITRLDLALRRALDAILNAGYDCDLGDENYIEEMGSIEGDRFRIGKMSYSVVVVPPSQTWRPTTFERLKQFAANGGKLIFLGETPAELDCEPAARGWQQLAKRAMVIPSSRRQIQEAVEKVAPRSFILRDPNGKIAAKTYVQHRIDRDQEIFFIVNSDTERAEEYVLTLMGAARNPVAIWNPVDGSRSAVTALKVGKDLRYAFTLPPVGSLLLVLGPGADDGVQPVPSLPDLAEGKVIPLPRAWDFSRSEENVLVLDRIAAALDGGKTWWGEEMEFRVRRRLAEHFGTTDSLAWQPWVAARKGVFKGKGGDVILRYRFNSALDRPASAFLVVEDLTKGAVSVNGKPVDLSRAGWHWDHDFGKVEITDLVKRGENLVDYRVAYDFLTEVEPAYIVGDFGVRLKDHFSAEIIAEPKQLRIGSWQEQGYPFYSGGMTYRTSFNLTPRPRIRTFLRLTRPSGILFKVRLNGQEAGKILWRPYLVELTPFLKAGANSLEIEVISSRQNSLGPLHEREGEDNRWVGPNAFESEGTVRPELSLYDYGLLGGAELVQIRERAGRTSSKG